MQKGMVDLCITGADRVTKTGHVINKIGTYLKALAAKDNNIPFYVAVPTSTIDWETSNYENVPIENRDGKELSFIRGLNEDGQITNVNIYPEKSKVLNPSFDITPNNLVSRLITEKGIINPNENEILSLI